MISHFSQATIDEDGWYMDSGAMKYMIGSQEVFQTLLECDSNLHMVFGNKSQKEIQGSTVVPFRMEIGWVMWVQDVLFFSMIKNKGFEVLLQDGKATLRPRGSSSVGIVLGVRQNGLYMLTGKPMDHGKKNQEEQVQVQASQVQVQVIENKFQVPEAQRESSSSQSLQIHMETMQPKKSVWLAGRKGAPTTSKKE